MQRGIFAGRSEGAINWGGVIIVDSFPPIEFGSRSGSSLLCGLGFLSFRKTIFMRKIRESV